jgi:arylsulfatase A-like enzyme
MQDYRSDDRWQNSGPLTNKQYSSDLYGDHAIASLEDHDPSIPYFLYLPWQAVHSPHQGPDGWKGDPYRGMLWSVDQYMGKLVGLLKQKKMWDSTLLVYSADNGGTAGGNNYPYRGFKRTNWEGG